ncbi:hypothetical protein [Mucilaginibacter gilvus]|uniref:Uncharacterized protein n=1 Tax=Mucilaginibacter gilvus TaxID=2305909 RepID=A0A3S3V2W7_9SPHI|nr:hypothetical protein [Mucilaginibacter gilvus]RWY54329.1 hypothetical protein EPL05_09850 [Mucilaginibacter gilvus]
MIEIIKTDDAYHLAATAASKKADRQHRWQPLLCWHEEVANLGTHGNEGAELLTLDQVYTKAQNVWLKVDDTKNDVYFDAKNNGLISFAGYVPKGCVDDCFTGIMITEISKL